MRQAQFQVSPSRGRPSDREDMYRFDLCTKQQGPERTVQKKVGMGILFQLA